VFRKKDLSKKVETVTDRWWIAMFHPEAVDKNGDKVPQGFCQISLEIIPKNLANETPNGNGREQPN
jgi:hypothetical protein